MAYKGKWGKVLEKYTLKKQYSSDYCPKNHPYDLPAKLNNFNYKNVSIKSSLSNTILCSDIFNFLSSSYLDLIIIRYQVFDDGIKVLNYYLFQELDLFFVNLNKNVDSTQLRDLNRYIKSLKYPFREFQRQRCHSIAKRVLKKEFHGFRVNVKLSKTNQRIQCSLKLDKLLNGVEFECLPLKKLFKMF